MAAKKKSTQLYKLPYIPWNEPLYNIYTALRLFGPIIRYKKHPNHYEFELEESKRTDELKRAKSFKCGRHDVPVEWIEPDTQQTSEPPEPKRPKVADQASTAISILDALNDDCLRGIFSHSLLKAVDLCSLSHTCDRFFDVAAQIFRRNRVDEYSLSPDSSSLENLARLLRCSGEIIRRISIVDNSAEANFGEHDKWENDIVVDMIGYHCRSIESLDCSRFQPIVNAVARYERHQRNGTANGPPPFGQLKRLVFQGREFTCQPLPFPKLPSLTELRLTKLTPVTIDKNIGQFFAWNTQITRLSLGCALNKSQVEGILTHLINLEELHLDNCIYPDKIVGHMNLEFFGRLKRLKEFTVQKQENLIEAILEAMYAGGVRLEKLTFDLNSFPSVIGRMGSVKDLSVVYSNNFPQMPEMFRFIMNDPVLETVQIKSPHIRFPMIHEFVRDTVGQKKTVTFFISHDPSFCWRERFTATHDHLLQMDVINGMLQSHTIKMNVIYEINWEKETLEDFRRPLRLFEWFSVEE